MLPYAVEREILRNLRAGEYNREQATVKDTANRT